MGTGAFDIARLKRSLAHDSILYFVNLVAADVMGVIIGQSPMSGAAAPRATI